MEQEKTIESLSKEIDNCYEKIYKLRQEKAKLYIASVLKDKISLKSKFYRWQDPLQADMIYYGIPISFWFSEQDNEYIFDFVGFGGESTEFDDANWFHYDANHQWYIKQEHINHFVESFTEISENDFWNEFNKNKDLMIKDLKFFINYHLNNTVENE